MILGISCLLKQQRNQYGLRTHVGQARRLAGCIFPAGSSCDAFGNCDGSDEPEVQESLTNEQGQVLMVV